MSLCGWVWRPHADDKTGLWWQQNNDVRNSRKRRWQTLLGPQTAVCMSMCIFRLGYPRGEFGFHYSTFVIFADTLSRAASSRSNTRCCQCLWITVNKRKAIQRWEKCFCFMTVWEETRSHKDQVKAVSKVNQARGVAWGDVCQLGEERWGDSLQSCKKIIFPPQSLKEGAFRLHSSDHSTEESAQPHGSPPWSCVWPSLELSGMDASHLWVWAERRQVT